MTEFYIGLMSGTSIDAIDAVLVEFSENSPRLCGSLSYPIDNATRYDLHKLCRSAKQANLDEYSQLDVRMGRLFSEAARQLLHNTGVNAQKVKAIGSHGQTIYHRPDGAYPTSIQIGDPNIIAENTGVTTVADFRRRDMAAGGQGAPLVPAFHRAMFQAPGEDRAIVNIGGIANVTLLPGDPEEAVLGFDTGPGNTLLDQWAMRHLQQAMDRDARFARQGTCNKTLLLILLEDPYFRRAIPKSTGREHFNLGWLDKFVERLSVKPADVQASLCELTAKTIISAIQSQAPDTRRMILCGGGIHNPVLMSLLENNDTGIMVESSHAHGIDPDYVEAMAFAWLARQSLSGQHGNISSVTGARTDCILGGIYPGQARPPL